MPTAPRSGEPRRRRQEQPEEVPAGGSALALAGVLGGVAAGVAPVAIAAGSVKAATSGAAKATLAVGYATTAAAYVIAMRAARKAFPLVREGAFRGELQSKAVAFRRASDERMAAGMERANALPTKREVIERIEERIVRTTDPLLLGRLDEVLRRAKVGPGPREAAVRALILKEKRAAKMHVEAQVQRAVGHARQLDLERISPRGGFWLLDPDVRQHTPDCVHLAGHFFPHSVLRKIRPPIHVGCRCKCISWQAAIDFGLLVPGEELSVKEAVRLAREADRMHLHEAEEILLGLEVERRGLRLLEAPPEEPGVFEDPHWDLRAVLRLTERLAVLPPGGTLRLPDGTRMKLDESGEHAGRFRVVRSGAINRGLSAPEAALDALSRSARGRQAESIGGTERYESFEGWLEEKTSAAELLLHPHSTSSGEFKAKYNKLGNTLEVAPTPAKGAKKKDTPEEIAAYHQKIGLTGDLVRPDGRTIAGERVPAGMTAAPDDHPAKKKFGGAYKVFVPEEGERDGMIGVGVDAKGRVKREYTDEFKAGQAKKKFERVKQLTASLPALDDDLVRNAGESDDAAALLLIRATGARPGGERDRGGKEKAYGVTTLQQEHVILGKDSVRLRFVGKGGKPHDIPVPDKRVADLLRARAAGKQPGERLFDTDETKLNKYLKGAAGGEEFKVKDLRTTLATSMAHRAAQDVDPPATKKEADALRKRIATEISDQLGNTPAIALKDYINPDVWAGWP